MTLCCENFQQQSEILRRPLFCAHQTLEAKRQVVVSRRRAADPLVI